MESEMLVALVVEDQPGELALLRRHLSSLDVQVVVAHDYYSAVTHLDAQTPDLVLVGLRLPNESGYQLCEHIRARPTTASVPIVVTYEDATIADMANAEEAGASILLEKPLTKQKLAAAIALLLGGKGASGTLDVSA